MSRGRGYRRGIQTKLSLASGLLVLISLASFGLLSYFVTRSTLDDQMGERLKSHAKTAAATLQSYGTFLQLGLTRYALSELQRDLASLKEAANLDNVILIGADNRVLVDAKNDLLPGEPYLMLEVDREELDSVWRGEARASILYPGTDGRLYKSAYAPVMAEDGEVAAVVRVEASATFLNIINKVGFVLLLSALIMTAVAALLGMLVARTILIPIRELVSASQRIANGDLDTEVLVSSRDEIGFFARTFNQMTRNLKKLYEELAERGRQIAELSASVAHEVRSPISAIQGFTELLEGEMDDDDPGLEYIADIKNEINILNSRVTDFIHFARPMEVEPSPLSIVEVLESVLVSLDKEAADGGVSIVTNFGSNLPDALGDFEQLRGMFINLVRNAVQAMDGGGGLIITASATNRSTQKTSAGPRFVEVRIEDTGHGIPPEDLQLAFEPFFTTRGSGTGLGLAIVKKIVDAHSGKIELESDIKRGTTVRVSLPTDEEV